MSRLPTLLMAALLALQGLLPLAAHAAEPGVPAPIGMKLLDLPVPDGYVEVLRELPQLRAIGERVTPPGNRLLALFMAQDDLARARAGQPPRMQRYFMVQTLHQAEAGMVSEDEFAQLRSALRQQFQSLLSQASAPAQAQLDAATRELGRDLGREGPEALSLKLGTMQGLDVFDEAPASISLLAATKVQVQTEGRTDEVPMAMAITTAVFKGELLYFYAYAVYRDAADLDWLRGVTRDRLPLADASNAP